jgi:hypothetical protein
MKPDNQTLDGLLLSLLAQLIQQDVVVLEQTYQRCLALSQQQIHSSDTIRDLASVALNSQKMCFVIIDGLDECRSDSSRSPAEEQEEQEDVINWFSDVIAGQDPEGSHTCIRLLISGRRNGVLEEHLGSSPFIRLETAAEHSQDIETYAERRSVEICKKFRKSDEVKRDLINRVTSAAQG